MAVLKLVKSEPEVHECKTVGDYIASVLKTMTFSFDEPTSSLLLYYKTDPRYRVLNIYVIGILKSTLAWQFPVVKCAPHFIACSTPRDADKHYTEADTAAIDVNWITYVVNAVLFNFQREVEYELQYHRIIEKDLMDNDPMPVVWAGHIDPELVTYIQEHVDAKYVQPEVPFYQANLPFF